MQATFVAVMVNDSIQVAFSDVHQTHESNWLSHACLFADRERMNAIVLKINFLLIFVFYVPPK